MRSVRVALISPLAEEQWHSMDLCAEMLLDTLRRHHEPHIRAERVVPRLVRRFERLPRAGRHRMAVRADRLLNRFGDFPGHLLRSRKRFDLFHLTEHSYGQLAHVLPPKRTIVTCHDLEAFRCLLEPEKESRSWLYRAMARQQMHAVRSAARVVCDTHAVRDELLAFGVAPPERVTVVHIGTHPASSPDPDPVADAKAEALLGPAGSTVDLLHVGSLMPRKRIDVLLRVFAAVRERVPGVRLIRAGGGFLPEHLELVRTLGLEGSILVLPFVEREVLSAVYRRAALALQPSEVEGFGMPVPEAMACGTPVVASDIPVLREVGGSLARYCPVADVPAWTRAVVELLEERRTQPERWRARRAANVEHGALFSWRVHARKMVEVYEEVLSASNHAAHG